MVRRGSADVSFFLIGGYDILGTLTEFDDMVEAGIEDTTPLGAAWQQHEFVGGRRV